MFLEIETIHNEKVLLNVEHILYIAKDKKSTIIFDTCGVDYRTNEDFISLSNRLEHLQNQ